MGKRSLEKSAEELIAYKFLTSTTGSFSDRAKLQYEKIAEIIGETLKTIDGCEYKDLGFSLSLRWDDKAISTARKIKLGIEEFKQKYPKKGKELQNMIDKHREIRRAYLEFEGDSSEKVYINLIQKLVKCDEAQASKILEASNELGVALEKDKKGLQTFLLSE